MTNEKNRLLQEIRALVLNETNYDQTQLLNLYQLIEQGKYDKNSSYRPLWQNRILIWNTNIYGRTSSGEKALDIIRNALLQRIVSDNCVEGKIISSGKLQNVFSGTKNGLFILRKDYLPRGKKKKVKQGPRHINFRYGGSIFSNKYPFKNYGEIDVYRGGFLSPADIIINQGMYDMVDPLEGYSVEEHIYGRHSGGISTTRSLKIAEMFAKNGASNREKDKAKKIGFVYRIRLKSYQAIDVNCTLIAGNENPYKGTLHEMLVTRGITLAQIEVRVDGDWYKLTDIEKGRTKKCDREDLNDITLKKAIKALGFMQSNKAEEILKSKYVLQQALVILRQIVPSGLNEQLFNILMTNFKLQQAVIAIDKSSSESFIRQNLDILSRNFELQEAIVILWRTCPDLINNDILSALKTNFDVQLIIKNLAVSAPNFLSKDTWQKINSNGSIRNALTAACLYINNSKKQFFTTHDSIAESVTFIRQIIIQCDDRENVIAEAKKYIEGDRPYSGPKSSNKKNSRRMILKEYLNFDFGTKSHHHTQKGSVAIKSKGTLNI